MYEVVVGNVGTVYHGEDADKARREYEAYVLMSTHGTNCRAYQEQVTLFLNGEIEQEYNPPTGDRFDGLS